MTASETATSTCTLTDSERNLSIAAVVAAAFGVGISFGVGYPLTSLTLEAGGSSKWVIGLAGAAPALATIVILPFAPRLLAMFGPVALITIGCAVCAAGFLALGAATSPEAWIVIRLIMSAGLAIPWLVGETWINLVTQEATRGRVIAIYAMAFFLGFALGPTVLGLLGTTGPAPFIAGAIGAALAGVPIVLARNLAPEVAACGSLTALAAIRFAPVAMIGAFIGGFAEITYLSLIPNVALAAGIEPVAALGLMTTMSIGGLLIQYPIGHLVDRMSRISLLMLLAALFAVLSLLLPLALTNIYLATVAAFVIGGVILGFYTVGLTIIGETVPGDMLAATNAAFIVMYQIGAVVGPAAAGVAMTAEPVTGFVATVIVLMGVSALALYVSHRRQTHER